MSAPDASKSHFRQLAPATYSTRHPYDPPPGYAQGQELDWLETLPEPLGPVADARRAYLRQQRAIGAISEKGERWLDELAARGLLPVKGTP